MGKDYDRVRPSYPLDAIRWATPSTSADVVDLGCGSGKLTLRLAESGHRVVGVDPSVRMLEGLRGAGVPIVCGTAEDIPLAAGCADVVTAAQAFHWFDHGRALPEIRRVLRPGGDLALLWNFRDEAVSWVRELSEIIGSEDAMRVTVGERGSFERRIEQVLVRSGVFDSVETRRFSLDQEMDRDHLAGLVASRSYVSVLDPRARQELLEAVSELCRTHPELRGRERFALPYVTITIRARTAQ